MGMDNTHAMASMEMGFDEQHNPRSAGFSSGHDNNTTYDHHHHDHYHRWVDMDDMEMGSDEHHHPRIASDSDDNRHHNHHHRQVDMEPDTLSHHSSAMGKMDRFYHD